MTECWEIGLWDSALHAFTFYEMDLHVSLTKVPGLNNLLRNTEHILPILVNTVQT